MLVYDGECGFCSRAVRFVVTRDPGGRMLFAPRDGAAGRRVREVHSELREVEALLLVERSADGERVHVGSDAVLRTMMYLGGAWGMVGRAGSLVPRALRDPVYAVVARVRKRVYGRVDPSCLVVPEGDRGRFLP
jgi:predicted DCC family thiol-disulfide oxidoreductase YuxK